MFIVFLIGIKHEEENGMGHNDAFQHLSCKYIYDDRLDSVESLASGSSESVSVASEALSDADVGVVGAVGESDRPRLRARRRPLPVLEPLPLPEPYGWSRPRPAGKQTMYDPDFRLIS
ncbi:hypothetical protein ACJJTC_000108 [Scirpophaga incertulas]